MFVIKGPLLTKACGGGWDAKPTSGKHWGCCEGLRGALDVSQLVANDVWHKRNETLFNNVSNNSMSTMLHGSEHHDNAHTQLLLPRAAGYDAVLRLHLCTWGALAMARPGRTVLSYIGAAACSQGVACSGAMHATCRGGSRVVGEHVGAPNHEQGLARDLGLPTVSPALYRAEVNKKVMYPKSKLP